MCAAWTNNNTEDAAAEQQWAQRFVRLVHPAFSYALDVVLAPVHLVQRLFYRPNTIQDEFVVEDLAAKCKSEITQTYIQSYTQKMRTRTVEGKFDPRRTYDNLESCQSGTFKIPGYVAGEQIPDLILIDEIKEPEPVNNVVYLHSPSLSDSQILRARPSLSDSQVLRARPKFTGTESGTYINMPNLAQMQANVASIAPCNFTQSGVYQLVEPDINPHGLQQFIEETKEEKSA